MRRGAIALAALLIVAGCGDGRLDNEHFQQIAPNIYRDTWTGCQYIVPRGGKAITPRMSRYGRQICHNEPVDIDVSPPYRDENLVRNGSMEPTDEPTR